MYDRVLDDPRLSRWYAPGEPPPHPALDAARTHLEARLGVPFSGVACNYYRDGDDSVAWHADRELRKLHDTRIAILTLGARRSFLLRPAGGGKSRNLAPASGDLLVMGGACQMRWEHAVPKTKHSGPRVSCSWRWTNNKPA
jgi:alkylated DNA repair dioxygenase AlkB